MISRAALAVSASILASLVVGCAASEEPTAEDKVLAEAEWSPPLTGGVCPDPAVGSTKPPEYYQQKATDVVQYLVGGKSPFTYSDVTYNPACADAKTLTTNLRNMLGSYGSKVAPQAYLHAASSGTVCGLHAALYQIEISPQVPLSVWDEQKKTGELLDKCWGVGVSGFYYADASQDKYRKIMIDPEPARLTADLVGSTGATAASVYVSSGVETKTLKWPGSYVSSAYPPPAGTPCSTTDLPKDSEALKLIQGTGSYRRCY